MTGKWKVESGKREEESGARGRQLGIRRVAEMLRGERGFDQDQDQDQDFEKSLSSLCPLWFVISGT